MPKSKVNLDRPPKTPITISYIQKLQDRAKKVAQKSKSVISLTLRIPVPLYEALIELAEEWHAPVSEVARQCLSDGARKYNDFAELRPGSFAPRTPLQQVPGAGSPPIRRAKSALDLLAERARRQAPPSPAPPRELEPLPEADEEAEALTSMIESMGDIPAGALLPFGGTRPNPPAPAPSPSDGPDIPLEEEDSDALA